MKLILGHGRDSIRQDIISAVDERVVGKSRLYRLVVVDYINIMVKRPRIYCGCFSICIGVAGSALAREGCKNRRFTRTACKIDC